MIDVVDRQLYDVAEPLISKLKAKIIAQKWDISWKCSCVTHNAEFCRTEES